MAFYGGLSWPKKSSTGKPREAVGLLYSAHLSFANIFAPIGIGRISDWSRKKEGNLVPEAIEVVVAVEDVEFEEPLQAGRRPELARAFEAALKLTAE